MRVVLDTNVLISGIFFGGPPGRILDKRAEGTFELLVTPGIFDEYLQTCDRLAVRHPDLEYRSVLATIVGHGTLVPGSPALDPITADPADDKFICVARDHGWNRRIRGPAPAWRLGLEQRASLESKGLPDPPRRHSPTRSVGRYCRTPLPDSSPLALVASWRLTLKVAVAARASEP